jgi:hypothetical protein
MVDLHNLDDGLRLNPVQAGALADLLELHLTGDNLYLVGEEHPAVRRLSRATLEDVCNVLRGRPKNRSVGAAETPKEAKVQPRTGSPKALMAGAKMALTKAKAAKNHEAMAKWEARIAELLRKHAELRPAKPAKANNGKPGRVAKSATLPAAKAKPANGNGGKTAKPANGNGKPAGSGK